MQGILLAAGSNGDGGGWRFCEMLSEVCGDIAPTTVLALQRLETRETASFSLRDNSVSPSRTLADWKRALEPSLAISILTIPTLANAMSRRRENTIGTLHSILSVSRSQKQNQVDSKMDGLLRSYLRELDLIIVPSEGLRRDLTCNWNVPERAIRVIPNAAPDLTSLTGDSAKSKAFCMRWSGQPTILHVGRFAPVKQHASLIRAFRRVKKCVPDATLVLAGSGPLSETIRRYVAELNLEESVFFLGDVTLVTHLYSQASVLALCSVTEAHPYCILEALSHGLPVVSTDSPFGPGEILRKHWSPVLSAAGIEYADYGILVPSNTTCAVDGQRFAATTSRMEQLLADALIEVLTDSSIRTRYRAAAFRRSASFCLKDWRAAWSTTIEGYVADSEQ